MRPPALPIPEAGIASDDPLGLSVDEESPTGEVLNQPPLEFERPPRLAFKAAHCQRIAASCRGKRRRSQNH